MVRSTRPLLKLLTRSRSCRFLPPPAYVTGMEHHWDKLSTSCSSMPFWSPSLSAAWIKNSEQYGSKDLIDARHSQSSWRHGNVLSSPWFTSISVIVCHLFIATNQVLSFLRQLRSMTSFSLSPSRAATTESRRSWENFPSGKRKDVIMTYYSHQYLRYSFAKNKLDSSKQGIPFQHPTQSNASRSYLLYRHQPVDLPSTQPKHP